MSITIYPGTVKKRNLNGTYSDLVPGADANPQLANDIAEEYDPVAGVYSVGDYCIYQSVLYKCITAISTPEAFNSTKWTDVSVTDEIGGVKNTLNQLETETETIENGLAIIVEGNSCASGASQGQYIYLKDSTISGYVDGLYTAAQAIPANTAIDGTYLTAVTDGGLNSLKTALSQLIKIGTKTATTNNGGSANLGESISSKFILSIRDSQGFKDVLAAAYGNWWVNVYDTSGSTFDAKTQVELTFTYAYIDI